MGAVDYLALLAGAGNTIAISAIAILLGSPLGLMLALIRWAKVPGLNGPVAILVSLLRATPSVTLMLLVYFALPVLGLEIPRVAAAVATLALGSMAYNCEIWRGALLTFPKDQLDAAKALGMRRNLRLHHIILPQLVRSAMPALVNEMTLLIKVSPAIAVIGVTDVTRAAVRIGASTYQPVPPFTAALAIYLVIIGALVLAQRLFESRQLARNAA
jgi:His/Glu/Gln/Arg/opine family amino acid ABC transporter permease subunit